MCANTSDGVNGALYYRLHFPLCHYLEFSIRNNAWLQQLSKHCNLYDKDREVKSQIIQRCAISSVRATHEGKTNWGSSMGY